MANYFSVKKTIDGVEYTAQFNGIGEAVKAADRMTIPSLGITSLEKQARYIFENVIVSPRIKLEDFGADKIGTAETKEINGKKYTAEFKGILAALRAIDTTYDDEGNTSNEKFAEYLFKNIFTSPEKINIDDFETMEEFNEVGSFGREVMRGGEVMDTFNEVLTFGLEVMKGHFRDEAITKSAKTKSN